MKTIAVRPNDDLHARIKAAADERQLSMAAWLLQAGIDKLDEGKSKGRVGRPKKEDVDVRARVLEALANGPADYEDVIRYVPEDRNAVAYAIKQLWEEGRITGMGTLALA